MSPLLIWSRELRVKVGNRGGWREEPAPDARAISAMATLARSEANWRRVTWRYWWRRVVYRRRAVRAELVSPGLGKRTSPLARSSLGK